MYLSISRGTEGCGLRVASIADGERAADGERGQSAGGGLAGQRQTVSRAEMQALLAVLIRRRSMTPRRRSWGAGSTRGRSGPSRR